MRKTARTTAFLLAVVMLCAGTLGTAASVSAHNGEDHGAPAKAQGAAARLDSAELKRCQKREKAITNTMIRISDRGQRQIELFATIAERTQQFAVDHGRTVVNYEALVQDIVAKRTVAQAAVDAVTTDAHAYSCEADQTVIADFKLAMHTQNDMLKEYKTSVKNLIVAIKSAPAPAESAGLTGGQ